MKQDYTWICPNCRHQFHGHVFDEGTYGTGPICNACCVELEFLLEEGVGTKAAVNEPHSKKQVRAPHLAWGRGA